VINRTYTYIVFGVGVLLVVAAVLKLPVNYGPGIALAFLGIVMFGMSFIPRAETPADAPAPMSPAQRVTGIFFEPSSVFRDLRAHPHWLLGLVLFTLFTFAYATAFTYRLTPERIISYTLDKTAASGFIPADRVEQVKAQQIEDAKNPVKVVLGIVPQFVGVFVFTAIFAAVAMLLVMLFGGRIGFWQSFAVMIYAALPAAIITSVLSLVLLFVKDPDDIHPILGRATLVTDNLGALFKPAEHPVLFAAASTVGLLAFYRVWLTAIGIHNAGERVKPSTGWAVAIAFWVIGLLLAAGSGALFGSFLS
jgi:hypothetical protein